MTRDQAATVILERVLDHEGGVGQVDGESWITRFGQTPQWLKTFGFQSPETREDALANYKTWLVRTRLVGLCDVPDVLAMAVIDWAVNAGHPVAIQALQRALGVQADGILGPETQEAIDGCDRQKTAARVVAALVRFRGTLISGNPSRFARYAKGWAYRDADQIEALA